MDPHPYEGCRVVRGPDWIWGNEDGGEGHLGTVQMVMSRLEVPGSTATVRWDNGFRSTYRAGYNGCYDLRIYDNSKDGINNKVLSCSSCDKEYSWIRWKCCICDNYYLCHYCYMTDKHDLGHSFKRDTTTYCIHNYWYEDDGKDDPIHSVGTRFGAQRVEARGIFAGAIVECQTDVANAHIPGTGKVLLVSSSTRTLEAKCDLAVVEWNSGITTVCRLGKEGYVDIRCVQVSKGQTYYKEHLPVLGEESDLVSTREKQNSNHQDGYSVWDRPNSSASNMNGVISDKILVYCRKGSAADDFAYSLKGHNWYLKPIDQNLAMLELLMYLNKEDFEQWARHTDKVDITSGTKYPPMHIAAYNAYIEGCKILREKGASINDASAAYKCPLYHACTSNKPNHVEVIKWFLKNGANINQKCIRDGDTALMAYVCRPKEGQNILQYLVKCGGNINATTSNYMTPLHYAVQSLNVKCIESVIDLGGDLNAKNSEGETPLAYSLRINPKFSFEVAKLLVTKKADVNVKGNLGESLLHHLVNRAPSNGKYMSDLVYLLIENGIDVNSYDKFGCTVLHHRSLYINGNTKLMELFMSKEVSINASNIMGISPLHMALQEFFEQSFIKTIRFLLQNNANVNQKTVQGQTPLFYLVLFHPDTSSLFRANSHCVDEAIHLLSEKGASVNEQDNMGCTILHWVCYCVGYFDGTYYSSVFHDALLNHGLHINKRDNFGVSPLHMSTDPKVSDVLDTLLRCTEVKINIQDNYMSTPLHWAAWHGDYKKIAELVKKGGNLQMKDSNGRTPCDIIALQNHLHLSEFSTSEKEYRFGPHLRVDDDGNIFQYINDQEVSSIDEFLDAVLNCPGVGKIEKSDRFRMMKNELYDFVEKFADAIWKLDDRFSMRVVPSGSVSEGTKCGYPDEFDFMLVMDKFSDLCDVCYETESFSTEPGFVILKRKADIPERFEEFFESTGLLHKKLIEKYFSHLTEVVLKLDILPMEHLTLFTMYHDMRSTAASLNIKVKWRCSYYKELTIDIDLVPVLHFPSLCPPGIYDIHMHSSDVMKQFGLYVVLFRLKAIPGKYWRISYSCNEGVILKGQPEEVLNGYILAKALKNLRIFKTSNKNEVSYGPNSGFQNMSGVILSKLCSYTLKTAFLYLLENNKEENMLGSKEICKRIYQYLNDRCGREEDFHLNAFFEPEMIIWDPKKSSRWDIMRTVKFLSDFVLK